MEVTTDFLTGGCEGGFSDPTQAPFGSVALLLGATLAPRAHGLTDHHPVGDGTRERGDQNGNNLGRQALVSISSSSMGWQPRKLPVWTDSTEPLQGAQLTVSHAQHGVIHASHRQLNALVK